MPLVRGASEKLIVSLLEIRHWRTPFLRFEENGGEKDRMDAQTFLIPEGQGRENSGERLSAQ